jgi:hypothetical protein
MTVVTFTAAADLSVPSVIGGQLDLDDLLGAALPILTGTPRNWSILPPSEDRARQDHLSIFEMA